MHTAEIPGNQVEQHKERGTYGHGDDQLQECFADQPGENWIGDLRKSV